jgi:Protein of unknown function (DUF2865)
MKSFLLVSAAMLLASNAVAQTQAPNPNCQRLEAQLANVDRGTADPARADQIRRAEDALNRQQFELDKNVAQARRMGCQNSGFFSIFISAPPQCGGLNQQIDQQRAAIETTRHSLEQLNGGTTERAEARRSLLIALADNGCGPQYRQAALAGQQGGFFDRLFGTSSGPFAPSGPIGDTFRTVCVRSCDGYYFPISFSTTQNHFRDDEATCQRMCPAAEVQLYTYHNPGEDVSQAVSLNGRLYTELPAAFQYRKALSPTCSCRRPGESWADALRSNGPDDTIAPGDVIVTEQSAKRLSQPRAGTDGKPVKPGAKPAERSESALVQAPGEPDAKKRSVRTVGPTFLPVR